MLIIFNFFL